MKRILLASILLCVVLNIFPQAFEWISSSPDSKFKFPVINDNQTISIVIEQEQFNKKLYDAKGEMHRIFPQYSIANYAIHGDFNYMITVSETENVEIIGMTSIPHNGVAFLSKADSIVLNYTDTLGNITKKYSCDLSTTVEVHNFVRTPDGDFIITGNVRGELSKNISQKTSDDGGDFIVNIDKEGNIIWADVIPYQGARYKITSGSTKISVSPSGTIYLAGNYRNGGFFGGKTLKLASKEYDSKKNNDIFETYLACYSKSGKLKWVTTAQCGMSNVSCLFATEDRVFLSYNIFNKKARKSFGCEIDSIYSGGNVIMEFNNKGTVKSCKPLKTGKIRGLCVDQENTLYVFGDEIPNGYIEKYEFKKNSGIYVATFHENKKATGFWSAPLSVKDDNNYLLFDPSGNLYIAGEIWCAFPLDLSLIDKAFKNVSGHGGVSFIGKLVY